MLQSCVTILKVVNAGFRNKFILNYRRVQNLQTKHPGQVKGPS